MSLSIVVFVPSVKAIQSPEAWRRVAAPAGFDLTFPESFCPITHKGALPVACNGVEASLEYCCDSTQDYLSEMAEDYSWFDRVRIRRFKFAVEFVTHARVDDRFVAVVTAAALATACAGFLVESQSDEHVAGKRALAWAQRSAKPPDPEALSRRRRTALAVQSHMTSLLADLGYVGVLPLEAGRPGSAWFARPGRLTRDEIVEAQVVSDGDRSFLLITYFLALHPLEKIRSEGIGGNAAGVDHFYVLTDDLNRSAESVLPRVIPVDEGFPSSREAERLRQELHDADGLAFELQRQRFGPASH